MLVSTYQGESALLPGPRNPFAFSPDGMLLALGCNDGTVCVWPITEDRKLNPPMRLICKSRRIQSVAFDRHSESLFAAYNEGTVVAWDLTTSSPRVIFEQDSRLRTLALSPSDQILAFSGAHGIQILDAKSGNLSKELVGGRSYDSLVFLDQRTMISSGGECLIRIWDLEHDRLRCTLSGHSGAVRYLRVSKDGETVVSGSLDGSIRVWRAPR